MIQMFQFVTETMERYYQSKLLSVAHTRVDRFVSVQYQGLNAKQYSKDSITKLSDSTFSVASKTERGVRYWVDMCIGWCTCPQGKDGSPCSHQGAIVLYFGSPSVNCIPVMDPEGKQKLAYIAHGNEALQDLNFYCTLSQPSYSEPQGFDNKPLEADFSTSYWEHIRVDAVSDAEETDNGDTTEHKEEPQSLDMLYSQIDTIAEDMKKNLKDESFASGVNKFISTYHKLSRRVSNASLISSLHRFGWCFGGTMTSMKGGILRRGRRIPIQAKSAGRRKGSAKRGKGAMIAGRPPKATNKHVKNGKENSLKYFLPGKAHNNSSKRPHSLKYNISKGQQNSGKW